MDDICELQSEKAPLIPISQVCLWERRDPIYKLLNCAWHNASTEKCWVSCSFPLHDKFFFWWISRNKGGIINLEYSFLPGIQYYWQPPGKIFLFFFMSWSILSLYRFVVSQNGSTRHAWHTPSMSATLNPCFLEINSFLGSSFLSLFTHPFSQWIPCPNLVGEYNGD